MKQATGFISDAGNHFDNEFDAYKDDLRHKLQEATGNGPMARDAINAICAELTVWAGALGHMVSIAPKDVAVETREITALENTPVIKRWIEDRIAVDKAPTSRSSLAGYCDIPGVNGRGDW